MKTEQSISIDRIPNIRFLGFNDKWRISTLKDEALINRKTPQLPPRFIYIDLESVINGVLIKEVSISNESPPSRAQRVLENGDILFQTVRPYQKNNLYFDLDGDYVASTGYAQIKSKGDSRFLFQYLHTFPFVKTVIRWSTGTSYPAISPSELIKVSIVVPSLPEQQKIAAFLSAVDKRIQLLTRKKELLEQYKKGVMQKIFTREICFKDENGKDYPEWEETLLKEIADSKIKWSITGGPFGSDLKSEDYTDSGIRIIQLQNIGDGIFLDNNKIYTSEKKADKLKACNIFPNEIIMSKMGEPVARACFIPNSNTRWLMASDGIRLVIDKSKFDEIYIHDYINSPKFRRIAVSWSTGSTRKRIGLSDLKKIPVCHPCLKEQRKIGKFLGALSNKLASLQLQIENTQCFKKGLLQQMFV